MKTLQGHGVKASRAGKHHTPFQLQDRHNMFMRGLVIKLPQSRTWEQWQVTKLQPPFFSTGFPHLGQGLVLADSQFLVSLSSWHFCFHSFHLRSQARPSSLDLLDCLVHTVGLS